MIWCRKHRWLGHVLRHDNLLHDIIEGKMLDEATRGRKRMALLHDMMEGRDYGQLKELISGQEGDRLASDNACQKPAGNSRRLKKDFYGTIIWIPIQEHHARNTITSR